MPGERSVEKQGGRFGRLGDRRPLGHRLRHAAFAHPYAAVTGVQGGQGSRIDHRSDLGEREQKGNWKKDSLRRMKIAGAERRSLSVHAELGGCTL